MIRTERFKGLEEKIGYTFTNKRTLALAMTHSSMRMSREDEGRQIMSVWNFWEMLC